MTHALFFFFLGGGGEGRDGLSLPSFNMSTVLGIEDEELFGFINLL